MRELFLTKEEMYELTGYHKPSYQREVLEKAKIPFIISRGGRPVVNRSHFQPKEKAKIKSGWEPLPI